MKKENIYILQSFRIGVWGGFGLSKQRLQNYRIVKWREGGLVMQWSKKVRVTRGAWKSLHRCWLLLTELLNKQTIGDGHAINWARTQKGKTDESQNTNPGRIPKTSMNEREKTGNTRGNRRSMTVRVFFSILDQVPWVDFERICNSSKKAPGMKK